MAGTFTVNVPLTGVVPSGSRMDGGSFPTLGFAVKAIAEAVHSTWVGYAMGAPLPGGQTIRTRTPDYARSIQMRQVGDFAAVVYADGQEAEQIENGRPRRDLKKMLDTSAKTRVFPDGRRYLIIPFRHGTPGSSSGSNTMPAAVHGWWTGKAPSSVTRIGTRPSQTQPGVSVPARTYAWGDRLKKGDLRALGVTGEAARRSAGMVNFRKPGGTSGGAHSNYITFRTMVEGSPGWIVPAKPGMHPARAAAEKLRPVAEKAFQVAFEQDVAKLLGGKPGGS